MYLYVYIITIAMIICCYFNVIIILIIVIIIQPYLHKYRYIHCIQVARPWQTPCDITPLCTSCVWWTTRWASMSCLCQLRDCMPQPVRSCTVSELCSQKCRLYIQRRKRESRNCDTNIYIGVFILYILCNGLF